MTGLCKDSRPVREGQRRLRLRRWKQGQPGNVLDVGLKGQATVTLPDLTWRVGGGPSSGPEELSTVQEKLAVLEKVDFVLRLVPIRVFPAFVIWCVACFENG